MASLEVFIKPESKRIDDLIPVFSVSENKGEDWLIHTVPINYTVEPFQVTSRNMSVKCIPPKAPLLYRKTGVCRGIPNFLVYDSKHASWARF